MRNRLPKFQDIVSVYAVIATMLFAWTALLFFWYLPSWLHFMPVGEVTAVFAYVMAASFLEGLCFLLFLLVLCFVLPPELLRDDFPARGTAITLPVVGMIMIYFRITNENITKMIFSPIGLAVALVIAALFYVSTGNRKIQKMFIALSERLTVFLYIILPVHALSLLTILARNVF